MKRLLLICVLLIAASHLHAQSACGGGTTPAETCQSVCISCDFNGYIGSTAGFQPSSVPSFCSDIQNDQWIGFIANANSATFTVTPSMCLNGNGVQVAVYGGCGENFLACNGGNTGNGNLPTSLPVNLIPGTNYYLLIDGYGGDQCAISIDVSPANAVSAPQVGAVAPISGPTQICPGATGTYSVAAVTGAGTYTWTAPPGSLINGQPSPLVFDAPNGRTVNVKFGTQDGQVCVQADNTCFDGGSRCISVNVEPIPTTILPSEIICFEEVPYQLPWGENVSASGTYPHTYMSYQGCDSMVQKTITVKTRIIDNQPPRTVCIGSFVTVCGIDYYQTEAIDQICPSYQGCDSTIRFQLTVLNPVANILGSGNISCTNASVALTSSASPAGTIKMWRTSTGTVLATNANGISVTQPATIYLIVTQQQNGVTCTKSDTIVIGGSMTPPSATASATGILGCAGGGSATLSVLTNAASPTFAWTGPGGFTSAAASPTVTVAGAYTVVVRSGDNGCTASSMVNVTGNTTPPTATATGGTITCTLASVSLSATSNAANATYTWSGPGGYSATGAMPAAPATAAGAYIVTVTEQPSNCSNTATATVAANNASPGAMASVSGMLSCSTPNVTLNASTPAANPTFSWSGPGFTSALQNPSVSAAGTYSVTVTSGANGCSSVTSVSVSGNTTLPNVSSSGATLRCNAQSAALTGGSTTPNVSFGWTGPGGFTSSQQNPTVTMVGNYVLTVSATNGCTVSSTAAVIGDFVPPNASATGGTISCTATATSIMGNSTTTSAAFSWTGPGGFTSTQQNPSVTMLGNYILTVTGPNGCTATATATVTGNNAIPPLSATAGALSCAMTSAALNAMSSVNNVTYSWSGPGGYNATGATPTPATLSGTYTVTVTDPASGCTNTAAAMVNSNNTPPGATASVTGMLSCPTPTVTLNAATTAPTPTFAWSGPSFTSSSQNPSVGIAGTYIVTVTSGANGCTSTASVVVAGDNSQPNISSTGGALSCGVQSTTIMGNSTTSGVTFGWTGPGSFVSTQQNPTVTMAGNYVLTVSATNGCTVSSTAAVVGDFVPPNASATGGTISCTATAASIMGNSTTTSATFRWTGPGSFTSTQQNPSVTMLGNYILTVTGPNGCTATATATVTDNTPTPPLSATAGNLSCATTTAALNAMSSVSNATYSWSGPGGYSATGATPTPAATLSGTYTVTVTDPASGCTNTATAVVNSDNTPPGATASVTGMLSCPTPTVTLNAATAATNPTYAWSGAGFTSPAQNPSVGTAGTYTVTVTSGVNGCTSTASVVVTGDNSQPNASASGTALSCGLPSAAIMGNSTTSGVTFGWTGPGSFTSAAQNPMVTTAGAYVLTVSAANGCTATATATVTSDFALPTGVSAVGGVISCSASMTMLMGSSTTTGVTYGWSGPGAFTSPLQNPSVNTVGDYTLTVTGQNGCTASATTAVTPDANLPNATASGDTLNCTVTSLTLNGASSTAGVTPSWTGPNGFTSTQFMPAVTVAGTYVLTVNNAANGCSAQASATVVLDVDPPGATATAGTLTCTNPNFTLSGSSMAANVSWSWTGPGGYTSIVQNPVVTDAGIYTLTVTSADNGCTSNSSAELLANQSAPMASATAGILTCADTSVALNGNSTLAGTYEWSGPGGFSSTNQNVMVSLSGDYTVTVTAMNGCTDAETVTVTEDLTPPVATAQGDTITCYSPQVSISVSSTTAGATYTWSGPDNFTSTSNVDTVNIGGSYMVTITAPNGCVSTATALVDANTSLPVVALAASPDTLTCTITTIAVQATVTNPSSPVQTLVWTGPGGFTANIEDPSVTVPGAYTLVATSVNGCSKDLQIAVIQNIAAPDATAEDDTLTCKLISLNLNGSSTTPNVEFAWTGPNGFTSPQADPAINAGGAYMLTVTGSNGCTASATATVSLDTLAPGAAAASTNNLDCDDLSTTLQGSSPVASVVYAWSGPAGFSSTEQNPTATEPGSYSVAVTGNANGCTSIDIVAVSEDVLLPTASAVGDTIDCISGSAALTGNSVTSGVMYAWTGPGNFTSTLQNPANATVTGDYILTVTGSNACTASATAVISSNQDVPVVTLSAPQTLTCGIDTLTVTGTVTSPASGFNAAWSGPGGFTSTQPSIQVTMPGMYTYVVTNTANGCKAQPAVTIDQDVEAPQGITAMGGLLNCTNPSIALDASTTTTGVAYAWTGPGGFTSTEQKPDVSNAGTYTVVITATVNGCTDSGTAEVTQDPTVPSISVTTDTLTCALTTVVLNAETTTPNVTFAWSGPGIAPADSTLEDPTVSLPGIYKVTVKAASGCTSTFNVTVVQNKAVPTVTTQGDTLTCTLPNGTISAVSSPNVTYLWSGPGAFTSTQANPSVTLTGAYSVTVTAANGCTQMAGATVAADASIPQVSVTTGIITCKVDSVQLTAVSNVPVTWAWSGPGGFSSTQQNPTVSTAGGYTVVATASNGCSTPGGATVLADTNGPTVSLATPDQLDCATTRVDLGASVQTAGNYTFTWTTATGNIVSGGNTATPLVSLGGIYVLQVLNNGNGCTTVDSVVVNVDPSVPSLAILQKRDVSCFGSTNGSVVIDSIVGGTGPFVYSIDNMPFGPSTSFNSLPPGVHSIIVQDARGCELETSATILEPEELVISLGPDTTIHLGDQIVLSADNLINVTDTSRVLTLTFTPAELFTADASGVIPPLTPTYSFRYEATVVDENGCKASDMRAIIVDKTRYVYIPNIFDPESTTDNALFMISGGEDVLRIKSFQIFDRWGQMVHEYIDFLPNDVASAWNGKINGKTATPAVFVYYAEIEFIDGETVLYKGDVMVMH